MSKKIRVLINAITTKKNAGGAFQIAYNFVQKTIEHQDIDWIYVISEDLNAILGNEIKKCPNYYVFPTQPDFKGTYNKVKRELKELERNVKPDVVYSITSPSYFNFDAPEVMRFTNPWVTHPNRYSWAILSLKNNFRQKLYCWNQRRLLKKASYFVTQTEVTKKGIIRITGVNDDHVKVVKNVLPAIFASLDNRHVKLNDSHIHIACIGAPVPHKNFDIIPDVLKCLQDIGINNVRFHVTIPENESLIKLIQKKLEVNNVDMNAIVNHGRLTQQELAKVYQRCDLCFLPTLLEVFSVSTLEAMFFNLKIIATDFLFNREVLADAALYYKPMNAEDAARKISQLITDADIQSELSKRMKDRLSLFDNYENHFNEIKCFLIEVGKRAEMS